MRSIKIIANILWEGGGWGGGVWEVMKDKALRSEVGHFDPDHEKGQSHEIHKNGFYLREEGSKGDVQR